MGGGLSEREEQNREGDSNRCGRLGSGDAVEASGVQNDMPQDQPKASSQSVAPAQAESQPDARFMKRAVDVALENMTHSDGGPFGAVIVKDGVVIAESGNLVITNSDPTAHAEVSAIRLACEKLNTHILTGCEIYSSTEPCPMCLGAIYWSRLDRVWFGATRVDAADAGFDDKAIYDDLEKPLGERSVQFRQLDPHKDANKPLRQWAAKHDRMHY